MSDRVTPDRKGLEALLAEHELVYGPNFEVVGCFDCPWIADPGDPTLVKHQHAAHLSDILLDEYQLMAKSPVTIQRW